jgi:hypothetical protein
VGTVGPAKAEATVALRQIGDHPITNRTFRLVFNGGGVRVLTVNTRLQILYLTMYCRSYSALTYSTVIAKDARVSNGSYPSQAKASGAEGQDLSLYYEVLCCNGASAKDGDFMMATLSGKHALD